MEKPNEHPLDTPKAHPTASTPTHDSEKKAAQIKQQHESTVSTLTMPNETENDQATMAPVSTMSDTTDSS